MDADRPLALGSLSNASLFESLALPAWIFDPASLRIIVANGAAARLLGYSREELASIAITEICALEDRSRFLETVSRQAGDTTGVWTCTTRNGTAMTLEMFVGALAVEGCQARLVLAHDVTRDRRAHDALRSREAFLQCLIESSPDCINVLDLEGRLRSMSHGGQRILGIDDVRPYIGRSWPDMFREDASAAQAALERARRGGTARFEGLAPTVAGAPRWWDTIIAPIRDPAGEEHRLLAVSRDITERRLMEQERAQLYAESRETQQRLLRLHLLGHAISAPAELRELLPRVAARVIDVFECDGAGVLFVRPGEHELTLRDPLDDRGREVQVPADAGVARITAERRLLYIHDRHDLVALEPLMTPSDIGSLWGAPLSVGSDETGIIYLGYRKPRILSPEERLILRLFAEQVGAAIDKSRLYTAAQASQAEAQAAERRARFLAEAGRDLAGSLNYAETLQTVARLAVPFLADYCFFDAIEPGSGLRRVAWQHANRDRQAMFDEVALYMPSPRFAQHPVSRVVASGQSILVPEVTDEWLQAAATSPDHLEFMRALQARSVLSVPLRGHTGLVGVLTCATAESGRRYSMADVRLAEEVGVRAAVAIENARLYEAAVAAEREAAAADRAKDHFLAVLGHELRNPLAPIVHAIHLLDEIGAQTPAAARLRAIISRQARRLTDLVNELLDVSRIRLGKVALSREALDFREPVQRVFEAVQTSEPARGHDLTLELAGEPLVVEGDRIRVEQVVANLLDNALKYSPAGGSVRVSVWREGSHAMLSVRDRGIGIPPELLSTIFEPLVQGETNVEQARRGLGLGLAVVRSLVELHKGAVWAMSEGTGLGSEFIVRLPLLATLAAVRSEAERAPGAPTRLSILLVDNDHERRRALHDELTAAGHAVAAVATALEALKALKSVAFDAALIDLGLPLMDGCELARHLRLLATGSRLRLVALADRDQPDERDRAEAAGFNDYLARPIETASLLRVLSRRAGQP
jgi:PAS domain S-box-containing protein